MADGLVSRDGQVEHIGVAHHPKRNLALAGGALALAAIIGLYYFLGSRDNNAAEVELASFRKLMDERCKLAGFAGPTHPDLVGMFARNERMRAVVAEQRAALERGGAKCENIVRALKSVDFPVP